MMVLVFFFYLFVLPTKVDAYLDPGSSSFIFQILLGMLVGTLFTIKIYWKKIKNFFLSRFLKQGKDEKNGKQR